MTLKDINDVLFVAHTEEEIRCIVDYTLYNRLIESERKSDVYILMELTTKYICHNIRNVDRSIQNILRLIQKAYKKKDDGIIEDRTLTSIFQMASPELKNKFKEFRTSCGSSFPLIAYALYQTILQRFPELEEQETIERSINPIEIKKFLDKRVTGQEQAKEMMSIILSMHLSNMLNKEKRIPGVVLLIGPSGCGKTFLSKTCAEYANIPSVVFESSQITSEGWTGLEKSDIFQALYAQNNKNAEYGIIILDEFDKACKEQISAGGYDVGNAFQANMLTMFEGTLVRDSKKRSGKEYDPKNNLFILTGTFSEIRNLMKKKTPMGFGEKKITEDMVSDDLLREILIEYGLIPELVGRISNIVLLDKLSEDEIYETITSDNPVINYYEKYLDKQGKELVFNDDYLKSIAKKAYENETGIRGCYSILQEEINKAIFKSFQENDAIVNITFPDEEHILENVYSV